MIKVREHEIAELMRRFKFHRKSKNIGDACRRVSEEMAIPFNTVYGIQYRLRPTNQEATDYFKSQAFKLAQRVVRRANVEQAIDVLSRPNIAVLEPTSGGASAGGGRSFIVGVAVDSLGAVKVGVQIGEGGSSGGSQLPVAALPEAAVEEDPVPASAPPEPVGAEGDVVEGELGGGDAEEPQLLRPKRAWYRRDIKPPSTLVAAPLPEGRSTRAPGSSMATRLAEAAYQRKIKLRREKKERQKVAAKTKGLMEELEMMKKAREFGSGV